MTKVSLHTSEDFVSHASDFCVGEYKSQRRARAPLMCVCRRLSSELAMQRQDGEHLTHLSDAPKDLRVLLFLDWTVVERLSTVSSVLSVIGERRLGMSCNNLCLKDCVGCLSNE